MIFAAVRAIIKLSRRKTHDYDKFDLFIYLYIESLIIYVDPVGLFMGIRLCRGWQTAARGPNSALKAKICGPRGTF